MPILNYTTQIKYEKTIMEIQKVLVDRGATKIVTDYDNGMPVGLTFGIEVEGKMLAFSLPANYSGVLRAMKRDKKVPKSKLTEEQALRVSWRIIKDWVEAQMAIVEADLANLDEVFLPYSITRNGNRLYDEVKGSNMLLDS
jgi:hypothetical protein